MAAKKTKKTATTTATKKAPAKSKKAGTKAATKPKSATKPKAATKAKKAKPPKAPKPKKLPKATRRVVEDLGLLLEGSTVTLVEPKVSAATKAATSSAMATPPAIPTKAMRAECAALLKAAKADFDALSSRGITKADLTQLKESIELTRFYDAKVRIESSKSRSAEEIALEERAKDLRSEALAILTFALVPEEATPEGEKAAERIDGIREGEGIDDLVADTTDTATFLIEEKRAIAAIGEDPVALAAELTDVGKRLEDLVATRRGAKGASPDVTLRDRAANALWAVANKIRRAGRFHFRNDAKRARSYTSTYNRVRRAVAKAKATRAARKSAPIVTES
ncbi:MAG: hypothetical protein JNM74_03025 [Myxococcales bacterium]|nr:hypothetical protein [Myxococcales bacterium]